MEMKSDKQQRKVPNGIFIHRTEHDSLKADSFTSVFYKAVVSQWWI